MNPEWVFAAAALIAAVTGWAVKRQSKSRMKVEEDNLTVAGSLKMVKTAIEQGDYLDKEMTKLREKIDEYRSQLEKAMAKIDEYRRQLEAAVLTEQRLSDEIRTLREKVRVLHEFIVAQGLEPPVGINT